MVQDFLKLGALLPVKGPPDHRQPRDGNVAHADRNERPVLALAEVSYA
ncbi:MAG: hypothetical protein GZ088_04700 [Acidipila sp.]|nr:hypothetical protein [Acidipila sp.]